MVTKLWNIVRFNSIYQSAVWRNVSYCRCHTTSYFLEGNSKIISTIRDKSNIWYPCRFYSDSKAETCEQYKPIYRFKPIVIVKMLSRLKIYQTGLNITLVPISGFLYYSEFAPAQLIGTCFSLATIASVTLFLFSGFAQKIIGLISVNDDMSKVKISHLSFWGKRMDEIYRAEEIVHFSYSGEDKVVDIYSKVTFFTDNKCLYLFSPGGKVMDYEKFRSLFGEITK